MGRVLGIRGPCLWGTQGTRWSGPAARSRGTCHHHHPLLWLLLGLVPACGHDHNWGVSVSSGLGSLSCGSFLHPHGDCNAAGWHSHLRAAGTAAAAGCWAVIHLCGSVGAQQSPGLLSALAHNSADGALEQWRSVFLQDGCKLWIMISWSGSFSQSVFRMHSSASHHLCLNMVSVLWCRQIHIGSRSEQKSCAQTSGRIPPRAEAGVC